MSERDDDGHKPEPGGGFWSRRKAAVRAEAAAEEARVEERQDAERRAALEEKTDAEILEELGLPDPDTLGKDDDFTRFLARTVPERLRRRALRRLWVSNPVLACLDGLNDYEDDYTEAATASQVVRTAYKVGRGFLKAATDTAAEPAEPATESDAPPPVAAAAEGASAPAEPTAPDAGDAAAQHEEITAMQQTYADFGTTSIRLTQRDSRVQSVDLGPAVSEEPAPADAIEERPATRRRLKFDYD